MPIQSEKLMKDVLNGMFPQSHPALSATAPPPSDRSVPEIPLGPVQNVPAPAASVPDLSFLFQGAQQPGLQGIGPLGPDTQTGGDSGGVEGTGGGLGGPAGGGGLPPELLQSGWGPWILQQMQSAGLNPGRLESMLTRLFNQNPDLWNQIMNNNQVFGRTDLQRLIESGFYGGDRQQYLQALAGAQQSTGEGGGAGGGGGGGSQFDMNPFGGELGGYLQQLIDNALNNPGFGEELLQRLMNQASTTGSLRERDRITRRGGDFAASGLFGSGLQGRAIQDIEAQESQALQGAQTEIGVADAEMAIQSISQALQALQIATSRELGMGNLQLGQGGLRVDEAGLALQAALQEWIQNMWLLQNSV